MPSKLNLIGLPLAALPTLLAAAPPHGAPAPRASATATANRPIIHFDPRSSRTTRPTNEVVLSMGQGELINLPAPVTDVWISNPAAADVYVNSPRQLHLLGKDFGEATLFATNASGTVVYSANIRVAQNINSLDRMLKLAMPDADVRVTTVGQIAVMTGTVGTPAESVDAERLVTAILNPGVKPGPDAQLKIGIINRLKTSTPLQVMLQVRIAEVSRNFAKNIGSNLTTIDGTGGFKFGIGSGRAPASYYTTDPSLPLGIGQSVTGYTIDPTSIKLLPNGQVDPTSIRTIAAPGTTITPGAQRATIGALTKIAGLGIIGALDLGETNGQVSTLANPNLTCMSGETCNFLVGGEIPIPISQGLGAVSVEFKQYGIGLSYTATVLSDGRISLHVRPEVSQLSSAGAVQLNGTTIPALSTRRAETTVEMGSGQSMMIGGLLSNSHDNSIDKVPGIGDVPVLGALFRSNGWKRAETELVIVITPYLVKPVNNQADIILPTDGEKAPTDLQRVLLGELGTGTSGAKRPVPTMAPSTTVAPAIGAAAPVQPTPAPIVAGPAEPRVAPKQKKSAADAMPGFSN